jgi:hypothetical protein
VSTSASGDTISARLVIGLQCVRHDDLAAPSLADLIRRLIIMHDTQLGTANSRRNRLSDPLAIRPEPTSNAALAASDLPLTWASRASMRTR